MNFRRLLFEWEEFNIHKSMIAPFFTNIFLSQLRRLYKLSSLRILYLNKKRNSKCFDKTFILHLSTNKYDSSYVQKYTIINTSTCTFLNAVLNV